MREKIANIIENSYKIKEELIKKKLAEIIRAAKLLTRCLKRGNKAILFGNGGSAADCQHIATELVCRFYHDRRPLPAISLTTNTSLLTAISNDYAFSKSFSRQLEAIGQKGDVAVGISTSGNSKNVIEAIKVAKAKGLNTIALTGKDGGRLAKLAQLSIRVPSDDTPRIQEAHILIGHLICQLIEESILRE
ncbi:MAG: D-sedoheptulose 7-phosphate isomerase [Candidatus Omnitrophica bacterium]|nr:D-sedoheptulose 7-phosphate isomerase [Candidatus Omnitrophota bacterium]